MTINKILERLQEIEVEKQQLFDEIDSLNIDLKEKVFSKLRGLPDVDENDNMKESEVEIWSSGTKQTKRISLRFKYLDSLSYDFIEDLNNRIPNMKFKHMEINSESKMNIYLEEESSK